jgi:hypothetical protein
MKMDLQEIKKIAEDSLKSIQTGKERVDWDYINRYLSSIEKSRKFFDNLCALSVAIIGLIVPILISQKVILDGVFLFTSVILFSIEIILWIGLHFYIIKKEIEKWPIEKEKVDKKYEATIEDLKQLIDNPTPEILTKKQEAILHRYENEKHKDGNKSLLNTLKLIILNTEYWILGLFLVAFFLFVLSFKPLVLIWIWF